MSDLTDKMIAAGMTANDFACEAGTRTVPAILAAALRVLDDAGFTVVTHGTAQLVLSIPKMADEIEAG